MSMRGTATRRTVCEVLRQCNDDHQGQGRHDRTVRLLLAEAEWRAKRLSRRLRRKSMQEMQAWWQANPGYATALRRQEATYLCGRCSRRLRRRHRSLQDALGLLRGVIYRDSLPGRLTRAAGLIGEAQEMATRMQAALDRQQ